MPAAPRLRILALEAFERPMTFARPFRFGAVTVAAAPQAFVRATIALEGRGQAVEGAAAEMMMPKWFDKDPAKSPERTIDDLRASLSEAVRVYGGRRGFDTAFGHAATALPAQHRWGTARSLPALASAFGPALVDKTILDALLKALGTGLAEGLRANAPGLDARLAPDLADDDLAAFLSGLSPVRDVALRHTVGLLDPLDGPGGLADEIAAGGLAFLKVKIGGDVAVDLDRLAAIARILDSGDPEVRITLDANEQYDPARLRRFLDALERDPRLASLADRLLYVEQPFDRAASLATPLGDAADRFAFIIDEADGSYEAFPRAAGLGYRGVSSKACKGLYKSIVNAARAAAWNARDGRPGHSFVTGEDLTCQAGLGMQQDTALVAALGLRHVERNGHHYVDGFGPASDAEAERFRAAHPDLYARRADGRVALSAGGGRLPAGSLLATPGFASGAEPDWGSLTPLAATEPAFERIVA